MLFLEQAHASARMGHFVLDPKRRTIEFSSWVRDNIGLNDMPIPLERLPEIVPEDERDDFARRVEEIITKEDDFAFETNVLTAKGAVRTQRVSGIPAFENRAAKTGLIGFYGILQEITTEKQVNKDLIEARDKAQSELEARTNILAAVSHEIRTPLGGILGIIDQLKRERSAAERERALSLIEDSAQVLLQTLDAILQQARLAQDVSEREPKRFRPSAVAQRVAEMFRPLARRKAIRMEVNAGSQAEAMGDPGRIQQVLANFVSNAVKFTQAGAVSISVQAPSDGSEEWTFVVSDTGAGMDQQRVHTIFDPYDTAGSDSLGRSVGAGLGLSITRDIVEALNGRIVVESEVGSGSSFTIYLPLKPVAQEQAGPYGSKQQGTLVLAVKKATEQIQIEATASELGWHVVSPAEWDTDINAEAARVVTIADHSAFEALDPALKNACEHILLLGAGGTDRAVPEELVAKTVFVQPGSIARVLPEMLDGVADDAA